MGNCHSTILKTVKKAHGGMQVLQFTPLFLKNLLWKTLKRYFPYLQGVNSVRFVECALDWGCVCLEVCLCGRKSWHFPQGPHLYNPKLTNLNQNNTESHHFYKKSSVRKCHRRSQDILASFCCWFEVAEGDLILFWVIVWLCECEIFWVWGPTFRLTQLPIN